MQAADEHGLQLVDVLRRLDGDAQLPRGAQESVGLVGPVKVALTELVVAGEAAAARCALSVLADVQVAVLRGQAAVVLVRPVVQVVLVLWARAVAGALGRAVGHHAGLQAAVPPHGPVQVQPGNQRLPDVHAFGPEYRMVIVHGCKRSLKANGENQLLLLREGLAERKNV